MKRVVIQATAAPAAAPAATPAPDSDNDEAPASPLTPWADRSLHHRLTRSVHYVFHGGDRLPSGTPSGPTLALSSKVFSVASMAFVMISVLQLCIESLPYFTNADDPVINALDIVCIAFFTMEFLGKLYVAPSRRRFLKSASTAVDLVSILPFYFDILFSGTGGNVLVVFRIVRLTRVFRVFKLSKFNTDIVLVFTTIHNSRNAISLLIFLLMIALTIFSSLIYYAEQGGCEFDTRRELWIRDRWDSTFERRALA